MTMGLVTPAEAGNDPFATSTTNNTLWLNYTSVVASDATNKVSAKLDQLVPGIDIKLTTAAASGSASAGTLGTPTSQITLNETNQDIVTGIGTCYTGDGASNGHNLTYDIAVGTFADILAATNTVTVTYTITAE